MRLPTVPEYIRTLAPYVPGKPIEETQREYGLKRVIKLASNENPLGPGPKARRAVEQAAREAHRYPDGSAYALKQALATHLHVAPGSLIIGNGSEEVIGFLIRAYCVPGDQIVTSQAAFIAYRINAQMQGVGTLTAPLAEGMRFDLPALAEAARQDARAKIIFVANPNNPTGTYNTVTEVRAFLKSVRAIRDGSVLVALDSAYWEYVTATDLPDPVALMREFPNVVVLRTFSKIHGLAGLRVGYGVAVPEIIHAMGKVRAPFNVSAPALAAAEAALGDAAFVRRARALNARGKRFWEKALAARGVPFWPSQGNFLLADVERGLGETGAQAFDRCIRQGVIFRPIGNYGITNALRISFGTMEENELGARALLGAAQAKPKGGRKKSSAKKTGRK